MRTTTIARLGAGLLPVVLAAQFLAAQGTAVDYSRADQLNARYEGLAVGIPDRPTWIGRTSRLWYRRTAKGGGYEFMVVDVAAKTKHPAFDHARLADAIIRAGLSGDSGRRPRRRRTARALRPASRQPTFPSPTSPSPTTSTRSSSSRRAINWKCTTHRLRLPARRPGQRRRARRPRRTGGGRSRTDRRRRTERHGAVRGTVGRHRGARRRGDRAATRAATGTAASSRRQRGAPFARRTARSVHRELQRVRACDRRTHGLAAHVRRVRGRSVHAAIAHLVAQLRQDRRLSRDAGLPPARALRRVVARGSAAAEVHGARLCETRRRARRARSGAHRRRDEARRSRRSRALPESVPAAPAHVAQGQPSVHVRVQSARPSGLSRHRGGREHRRRAVDRLRGVQGVRRLSHRHRRDHRLRHVASATTSPTARR